MTKAEFPDKIDERKKGGKSKIFEREKQLHGHQCPWPIICLHFGPAA